MAGESTHQGALAAWDGLSWAFWQYDDNGASEPGGAAGTISFTHVFESLARVCSVVLVLVLQLLHLYRACRGACWVRGGFWVWL